LSEETLLGLLRSALQLDSQWINDAVFSQIALLSEVPADVLEWVRTATLRFAIGSGARRKRPALSAQVSRLRDAAQLNDSLRLAYSIRPADAFLPICTVLPLAFVVPQRSIWMVAVLLIAVLSILHFWYWRSYNTSSAPIMHFVRCYYIGGLPICTFFLTNFFEFQSPILLLFVVLGVYWYVPSWPNSAVLAAKKGKLTSFTLWPFIPIFAMLEIVRISAKFLVSNFIKIVIPGAITALSIGLCEFLLFRATDAAPFILAGLAGLGLIPLLLSVGLTIVFGIRDSFLLRSVRKEKKKDLQAIEIVNQYRAFKTGIGKHAFLHYIRSQAILSRSSDIEPLKALAIEIEKERPKSLKYQLQRLGVTSEANSRSLTFAFSSSHNKELSHRKDFFCTRFCFHSETSGVMRSTEFLTAWFVR
jgi:hypothetical protein